MSVMELVRRRKRRAPEPETFVGGWTSYRNFSTTVTFEPETTERDLEREVADAAAVLDEHVPGWHKRVTRPINMASMVSCVLGQVFEEPGDRWGDEPRDSHNNGYTRGADFLYAKGYMGTPGLFASSSFASYWQAEVDRRRAGV